MSVSNPISAGSTGLVARVKAILLEPKLEWDKIDGEPASIAGLYSGYAVILAAIRPLAQLIHGLVFGYGAFGVYLHLSPIALIVQALVGYGLSLAMIYVVALIIDGLASNFGGQKNLIQAFKVATYASTASWIAGIFNLLPMALAGLLALFGGLYSLYLLYLGLPRLMKAPQEQALGYTAVTVVVAIVLSIVIGVVVAAVTGPFGGLGGGLTHRGI